MRPRPAAALAVLAAAAVAGCAPKDQGAAALPGARPHVVFQTDWYASPEHGGYYQALLKGYYQDAGLDLELNQGGPGGLPVQKLLVGQADFIMEQGDEIIRAVARGLPLVIVCAQLQYEPLVVYVHEGSPVKTLPDLNGRTVRAEVGAIWVDYVQRHYKIAFAVAPTDYGHAVFNADPTAATQGYVTDVFNFNRDHVAVRMLPVYTSGYAPYRVIAARRDYVRAHPDIVRAFIAASVRGWRDFMDGDATAAEARIARDNPIANVPFVEYGREVMRANHLVAGTEPGEGIGMIRPDRLQREIDILHDLGLVPQPLTVPDVAILDYQPKS